MVIVIYDQQNHNNDQDEDGRLSNCTDQGKMMLTKLHKPEQTHPKELEPDSPDKQIPAIQLEKQTGYVFLSSRVKENMQGLYLYAHGKDEDQPRCSQEDQKAIDLLCCRKCY